MPPRLTRSALVLGVAGVAAVAALDRLPEIAEWKLRRELADRGFPGARFRVVAVELHRLELADVELAPGLVLGSVELDAGVSLLWRDAERVRVRGARVDATALPRGGADDGTPRTSIEIIDSVVIVAGHPVTVAGKIEGAATRVELAAPALPLGGVTLRDIAIRVADGRACGVGRLESVDVDACATRDHDELAVQWRAADARGLEALGAAHVGWGSDSGRDDASRGADNKVAGVRRDATAAGGQEAPRGAVVDRPDAPRGDDVVEHGRDDRTVGRAARDTLVIHDGTAVITAAHWRSGGAAADRVTVRAAYAGSPDALSVHGTLAADRVGVAELALAEVVVPFELRVRAGVVSIGPRVATAHRLAGSARGRPIEATDVVVHRPAGVVDGAATAGPIEWSAAELRAGDARLARAAGTLAGDGRVTWRADTVSTEDAEARGAAGEVAHDGSIRWRAAAVTTERARLVRAAGTIAPDRTVRWHAARVVARDVELADVHGTVAADRSVTWRARSFASPDVRGDAAAGAIAANGVVSWRAAVLRAGEVQVIAPRGTVEADGSIDWTAEALRWNGWLGRAPAGRADHAAFTVAIPRLARDDVALADAHAVVDRRARVVHWRAGSMTRGALAAEALVGEVALDTCALRVAWRRGRYARFVLGPGEVAIAPVTAGPVPEAIGWRVERARLAAYGGTVALAAPARTDGTIVLAVRGLALAQLLRALPTRAGGTGRLDGSIVLRGGDLERVALVARGGGRLYVGDRGWLDDAVARIAAGEVAVPARIAGALADFAYTRLGILLTPDRVVQLDLHGRGTRIAQELDLVLNLRGLRESANLFARHRSRESR